MPKNDPIIDDDSGAGVAGATPSKSSLFRGVPATYLTILFGMAVGLTLVSLYVHLQSDVTTWRTVAVSRGALILFALVLAGTLNWLIFTAGLRVPRVGAPSSEVRRAATRGIVFGGVVATLFGLLALGTSPAPIHGKEERRQFIFIGSDQEAKPLLATTVFFPSGSPRISHGAKSSLRALFETLKDCRGSMVEGRAFVSSANYRVASDTRNLQLAEDRFSAVEGIAAGYGIVLTDTGRWTKIDELKAARVIDDGDGLKRRKLLREAFNRRVEIRVVSVGECAA